MALAVADRSSSPKRKRDVSEEITVINDKDESKKEVENAVEEEEVISIESSKDEILKQLPQKRKKGRKFVNFVDSDSEEEDEYMDKPKDDEAKDDFFAADIEEIDNNENFKISKESKDKEIVEEENKDKTSWTEDKMKIAVALWNDLKPVQVYHVKGRWYHMY